MPLLLFLPILIPLLTAVAMLFAWRRPVVQRVLGVAGTLALLASSVALLTCVRRDGIQAAQAGNWPAPFGITLVSDLLSALMVLLTGITGLAVSIYALYDIDRPREEFGYHPLFQFLLMGVCGAFLTGDLFNLYVWFEVMLIASFVLLALGGRSSQLEGAVKYVTLNLLSSAIFLAAAGIVYSTAGSLNMADLAVRFDQLRRPDLTTTVSMLFLVAFGVKAAVFPLFFWLPASYHTPPVSVSAIFAGLLTKVGVYALLRVFTLLFVGDIAKTHTIILVIAALTMITGVLGAAAQMEFRRILSFHIVSQIGYMILGLGLLTPLALAGSVFYIAHHIIVKANLFLVSGLVYYLRGSFHLKMLGGVYRDHPGVALLFAIPAFSLAGVPPLSGFWAKLFLIQASLASEQYLLAGVALVVGLLTMYSMTKIWAEVFWKDAPDGSRVEFGDPSVSLVVDRPRWLLILPITLLAALTLGISISVQPVLALSLEAATQLLDRSLYIDAVLKDR